MESISQLVSDSLARHGMEPSLDHLRLEWSRWFRCESSFSVLLVPAKPGIFSLGEEMIPPNTSNDDEGAPHAFGVADGHGRVASKRLLALFQISETDDLGMALGRLFLPGNPLRERLTAGRSFVRFTVIEDVAQRSAASAIFQRWMQNSAETASGISQKPCGSDRVKDTPVREGASCGAGALARETDRQEPCGADTPVRADISGNPDVVQKRFDSKPSSSSAWGVGFMEVQNREAREVVSRPTPLPSGF
jgi:hypothetical protein